jgi:type VI secretion system secreted protein VgrG
MANMPNFELENRILSLSTPLGENVLLPESLTGREAVSELFDFEVEMVAEISASVSANKLVGRRMTVGIQTTESGLFRYVNGIVSRFESIGGEEEFHVYKVQLVPSLWLLTLNINTRVFQNLGVIAILEAILKPYGITFDNRTRATYPTLDYCTQYRESDFAFFSRVMERWGIFYHFEHTAGDHKLVLNDASSLLGDTPVQKLFRYAPEQGAMERAYDYLIQQCTSKAAFVTGKHTSWDYQFIPYATDLKDSSQTAGPLGSNEHEFYDYLGVADANFNRVKDSVSDAKQAEQLLQDVRRDANDTMTLLLSGTSNARPLQPGFTFQLKDHPLSDLNIKYVTTSVSHRALQLPPYRSRPVEGAEAYRNHFTAIPSSIVYRAPQITPKPVVHGLHTARVVVPEGAESHMDKWGRVCVQFHWDRLRKPHTLDNTLLRVAQPWAGKGWGSFFWPRVNDEVIVDFVEGDPDQPLVIGSVYNGTNTPKYDPAGQYTRSGIVTRSSLNGEASNANELRFEDKKGYEQIFINAEKDMDLRVENDARTFVGNDRHLIVKGKQLVSTEGDKGLTVKGSHLEKIQGDADRSVGQSSSEKIGANYSLQVGTNQYNKTGMLHVLDAGQEMHIKGGMTVVIEGGVGLCLSGPGGFISIDASGVTIQGMLVKINSGGEQLEGAPAQVQDPKDPPPPDEADDGSKGTKKN